jgi:outer membrane protein W
MKPSSHHLLLILLAGLAGGGCSTIGQPLTAEPYSEFGAGALVAGVSTGVSFNTVEAEAAGQTGVLEGRTGTDTADLENKYGGTMKLSYMATDNLQIGGALKVIHAEADPIAPLSATLSADPFDTYTFLLSSRYFFDPIGESRRWRPYVGVDLGYSLGADLGSVRVEYPDDLMLPDEFEDIKGSPYWTLGALVGISYLVTDNLSLDMAAVYDRSITSGGSTTVYDNLGGASADVALDQESYIIGIGLSYAF